MQTLDPYQEEGARFLATKKKAMLADEPGEVGKTLQAIRACDLIGARRVLIVCPPSVTVNWRRYFDDSSLLDPELEIFTHKKLQGAWLKDRYDAIIADEAHYFKGWRSQRARAFYGEGFEGDEHSVVGKSKHVFLLTGSPAPNDPSELWTHLHALRPDLIPSRTGKPMIYHTFMTTFCSVRMTQFGPKIEGIKPSKAGLLRDILREFMLRRERGFHALPELTVEPLYVEAGVSLKDASAEMLDVATALDAGGLDALKALSTGHANLRRLLGLAKIKPTIAYVEDWLSANDGKIVVYAWHSEVINKLREKFAGTVASIDGSTRNRQAEVDKFQKDDRIRVFVGQMQAAGEAITLTEAAETVIVEPSWVPKDNHQTIKRIHRRGQTRPCVARFVTVAGSVDEDINRVLRKKEAMLSEMLGEGV